MRFLKRKTCSRSVNQSLLKRIERRSREVVAVINRVNSGKGSREENV